MTHMEYGPWDLFVVGFFDLGKVTYGGPTTN